MFQIIQDFEDWKNAKQYAKHVKYSLNSHIENITEKCSCETFNGNLLKENHYHNILLIASFFGDKLDLEQIANDKSKLYRASSCFYKLKNDVKECINVSCDKRRAEIRCGDCSRFKYLVVYQSLNTQLQEAQQKQEFAKQKLLDNFRFWKQK